MDKKVILAVAGSGKTTHIVNSLNLDKKSLLITYTNNNLFNLKNKIACKFGYMPDNISIYTYFTFLYNFCYKPFLWLEKMDRGVCWKMPPDWTFKVKRNSKEYYFDSYGQLYHNRLAKLLEVSKVLNDITQRLEKYFDNIFIDEIQDFGGHDFDFLKVIVQSSLDVLFVGDFYQHTFDTSRDGIINSKLYDDVEKYTHKLQDMGLVVDCKTLNKSYRCSPTLCAFITNKLGIEIWSHRNQETKIQMISDETEVSEKMDCNNTVKLFYQEHYKYKCFSRNWGESKGEDDHVDVCVVLNKKTLDMYKKDQLHKLNPKTKNKLYVACSRAFGNVCFIPYNLVT